MKTKYPSMFGILAAFLLVLSFVVPSSLVAPSPVQADPGICKWDNLLAPGGLPLKNDVGTYAIHDMAVGGDGATVLLTARYLLPDNIVPTVPAGGVVYNALFYSNNNGISFTSTKWSSFADRYWDINTIPTAPAPATRTQWPWAYLVAIAPDNPSFWAMVTDANQGNIPILVRSPREVWVTANAGGKWECTNLNLILPAPEFVRCIDISVD
ncbi:MAG: hypothetical protein A2Z75_03420 [Chloroflexi bacterium RBG_13_50_10]|nr:MAG: hypothetical protein A2Z75_03420 [Chloroflexi bacterium RBG_13_50_10]